MNYRIKKITTKNYKSWYMPQYQKKFLWFKYWVDIDDKVAFGYLGYQTKEEAMRRLSIRQLVDEFHTSLVDNLSETKSEIIELSQDELNNNFSKLLNSQKCQKQNSTSKNP